MKKHNENQFNDKFRFLQSQESSEEITWSCSDSSDYEYNNVHFRSLNNITNDIRRKRKRGNNRKKDLKNISNLDITIVETSSVPKSPILVGKCRSGMIQKSSPPLQFATKVTKQKMAKTSALTSNNYCNVTTYNKSNLKSPIIQFKNIRPKESPNVRKKLFKGAKCHSKENEDFEGDRSTSPILSQKINCLDSNKCIFNMNNSEIHSRRAHSNINEYKHFKDSGNEEINIDFIQCSSSEENICQKSHTDQVAKVKSYFDNHFISEASQLSITECETPTPQNSSKSSNEIDMATPKTQEYVSFLSKAPTTNTFESHNSAVKKKVKYKKGGLAYRLNELLKKQNSSVSLWQNERFLAANSNFVIPKQDFLVFRIKMVNFKYGIYLVEVVDKDDELFMAIINSIYVNNNTFETDCALKIYEPYKIVDVHMNCKIICNICKFECEKLII